MGAADEIFQQLVSSGWAGIQNLVTEERTESLHLDFKLKQNAASGRLDKDDRKNLSTALSGFANADGGVLVWGVDARRQGDFDRVIGIAKIRNLSHVCSELMQQTAESVSPMVTGVSHVAIVDPQAPDSGVVITLIPASESAPHMATGPSLQRYYRRSADSFRPLEHYEVADLFGRRPHPRLRVREEWDVQMVGSVGTSAPAQLMVRIFIKNEGLGMARFVAVTLGEITGPQWKHAYVHSQTLGKIGAPRGWSERFAGGLELVLYPGDEIEAARAVAMLPDRLSDVSDFSLTYKTIAADVPTFEAEVFISADALKEASEEAVSAHRAIVT